MADLALRPAPRIAVTIFNSMFPKTKREEQCELADLATVIDRTHAPSKESLPWLKLARFGTVPNDKGFLRYNENVVAISGLELDYDAGSMSIERAVEIAEKVGLACLIYASPSNTPATPKWRILCPFTEELDPIHRDSMMGRVNGLYGGIFDPASWTLSQSYYFGYVEGNGDYHQVEVVDGQPIDTLHELDKSWRAKPLHSARFQAGERSDAAYRRHAYQEGRFDYDKASSAIRSGENYHNAILSLAAHMRGLDNSREQILTRIRMLLDQVPPEKRDHRYKARASLRHLNGILDWVMDKENLAFTRKARAADDKVRETVAKGPKLVSETEALTLRKPQDWLIEGILERGYLYALTARSGSGKTAVALLMSYLVAASDIFPRLLGGKDVEKGNVIFLAGENPTDLIRRMAGIRGHYKLTAKAGIALVLGRFSIKDHTETIIGQIPKDREVSLVVVDTAQAFFEGEKENENADMLAYAQILRRLTSLPGNPAILVLSHPAKFTATQQDLVPRGGSSFYNEIDGNLTLWPDEAEKVFELSATKVRGPDFEPLKFEMMPYSDPSFVDTKGRPSSTVVARIIGDSEADERADTAHDTRTEAIAALTHAGERGLTQAQLTDILKATRPGLHRSTAKRLLDKLVSAQQVERNGSAYVLRATKPRNTRNNGGRNGD